MSLKSQRRLAAKILKVGENRIWINPDRTFDVEATITREEIRGLIRKGIIQAHSKRGISRVRARVIHEKRKKGLRRGPGRKKGSAHSKISKKQAWMTRIRALRKKLRELKNNRVIIQGAYRKLYDMAGAGMFESIAELERYIRSKGLSSER